MPSENVELRKAGLKVTLPRIKILQMLESTSESAEHLSAEERDRLLFARVGWAAKKMYMS